MISFRRVRALIVKEVKQITRDPSSLLIAGVLPLVLLFIFGYAVSLDSEHVPIGVVIEQPSAEANDFASAFSGSPYFDVSLGTDARAMERQLVTGGLRGVVTLRADFAQRLDQPGAIAPVQVITDGSSPQVASFVENYARGAWASWQLQRRYESGATSGGPLITVEPRIWFNPAGVSRYFLVPGAISIIMTLVGALLTALVIAREWERGTMEALLASPVTRIEMLLGKVIPYYALGLLSFIGCVAVAIFLFHVPLRGSFGALLLLTSIFLLGALGLGLTISAATRNQFLASQAALNAAFLPAFMLSGFLFEIRSMPGWIQAITHVLPARYFVGGLQTIFLAGDVWPVLWPKLGALALMATLLLALTAKNLVRRLDA